jgi:hypothetical protein
VIHTVQTSNRWVENDLALSPTVYTKYPSVAETPARPLTSMVGVLIQEAKTVWLLGMTSPILAFPPDATGFEAITFTNKAIHYGILDESLLDAEDDPALLAFLDYVDQQMAAHPELIIEADYAQLDRIAKLVEGVELEDDD